jgi:putative tricarboxylic transport membrane protein
MSPAPEHPDTPGAADRSRVAAGLVFMAVALLTIGLSLRMPVGTFRSAGPGLFPLCLGVLLAALAGGYTLRAWRAVACAVTETERRPSTVSAKPVLGFMAAIAFVAVFLERLGYAPTACIVVMALLQLLGPGWRRRNLIIALIAGAAAHLVFVHWLQIPFPRGWLGL